MKILIIGGGNMGLTFAKAFINSRVVTPERLMILEREDQAIVDRLKAQKIARIFTDPACVKDADLIVLAVKPQDCKALFEKMAVYLDGEQIILSIMAGVKVETITQYLKAKKIIRAMPNLPSQIGMGMTAFYATEEVTRFEQGAIQNLLATTGKTLNIGKEALIDTVTAISGSGPAYIYYFMDAMIRAAKELGVEGAAAELLVQQTFKGALSLFQQNSYSCQEWIDMVASKGGTTEAALKHFNKNKLDTIIMEGAKAAFDQSVKLGQ